MRKFLAIVAMAVLLPVSANAQLIDTQRAELVAACIANNTGPEDQVLFVYLMTALMQQDVESATTFRAAVVARAREIGINSCNQPETWFELPWAGNALGRFLGGTLARMFEEGITWLQALP